MIRTVKFAETGTYATDREKEDYRTAEDLMSARFSDTAVYFPQMLHITCLPYADIAWAYRRLEESHMSLGCCGGVLEEHKLMLISTSGKTYTITFERERFILHAMELLRSYAPNITIGYTDENRARFSPAK